MQENEPLLSPGSRPKVGGRWRWLAINVLSPLVAMCIGAALHSVWVIDQYAVLRTIGLLDFAAETYAPVAQSYLYKPSAALPQQMEASGWSVTSTCIPVRDWNQIRERVTPDEARAQHFAYVVLGPNSGSSSGITVYTAVPKLRTMPVWFAFRLQPKAWKSLRLDGEWVRLIDGPTHVAEEAEK